MAIAAKAARDAGVPIQGSAPDYSIYRDNPVGYARDVLKVKLTPEQEEILESVRDNRYTDIKASHGIGKTFSSAVLANWWFDCWPNHIVYVTAPTWGQALGLTFKQIKRLRYAAKLPGRILETGWVLDLDQQKAPTHFMRALNAEKGEGFQGEHSAPILIILEESVGVARYIWEAAGGLMTSAECRQLSIGNPTDGACAFALACEKPEHCVLTISGLDHPNIKAELACEKAPIPDAVGLQWLYEMLRDECEVIETPAEDSFDYFPLPDIKNALEGKPCVTIERWHYMPTAYFQGRVLGEFPTQADEQTIPSGWLKAQQVLEVEGMPEIGCDIARFGNDRTGICVRQGPCVLTLKEIRKLDTVEVEGALKQAAFDAVKVWKGDEWWIKADVDQRTIEAKKIPMKIDITGGLGAGPYDHLKADKYNASGVNSSEVANNKELYRNRRSELWFDTRDRARSKRLDLSRLPKEIRDKLTRELSSPKYKVEGGKKVVEEKATMKKRLGVSPDLADTVNLAFAPEVKPHVIKFSAV